MEDIKKILIISSDKNLRDTLDFCFDGWGYEVYLKESLTCDLNLIKKISPDVIVIDVQSARKSQLEICQLLKGDFTTVFIPIITIINKRQLRQQLLNIRQGIDDYLIKPPDPLDLRTRIEMAIRRSQFSFYTSALTGLPGGRIIEETLKEKVKAGASFTFAHADIDNFKYFNDAYGHIKGDRVIMQTAHILHNSVELFGNGNDFIGHAGGDDFVFISTPDRYRQICQNFIHMFDKVMPFHYSPQDRQRRFIVARDRTKKVREIPLISVSIAVVNKGGPVDVKNVLEINERAAEIKRYLKGISGSKFMADRRDPESNDFNTPQFNEYRHRQDTSYKPLGQILVEKKVITPEQLDESLKAHWERGVILGEILKEFGLVKEEELLEALKTQELLLTVK